MMDVEGETSLTEDLQFFKESLENQREERHGMQAACIAKAKGLLVDEMDNSCLFAQRMTT